MSDAKDRNEKILLKLLEYEDQHGRDNFIDGEELQRITSLDVDDLNDGVELLGNNSLLSVQHLLGTHPFEFGMVSLTARGRASAKDFLNQVAALKAKEIIVDFNKKNMRVPEGQAAQDSVLNLYPTGSPFGFTADDWVKVRVDKDNIDHLIVVFGHQWESSYFNTETMRKNLEMMFDQALKGLDPKKFRPVKLDFRPLQGGYGGHVFNNIAKDIIGSDIAIFDASDNNGNVMIEMGVALTWGIPTLPILDEKVKKLSSDISGLHWAMYKDSGAEWIEDDHMKKLQALIADAIVTKPTKRLYPG